MICIVFNTTESLGLGLGLTSESANQQCVPFNSIICAGWPLLVQLREMAATHRFFHLSNRRLNLSDEIISLNFLSYLTPARTAMVMVVPRPSCAWRRCGKDGAGRDKRATVSVTKLGSIRASENTLR